MRTQDVAEVTQRDGDSHRTDGIKLKSTTGPKARMIQRFFYGSWNGGIKRVLKHTLPHRT